MKVVAPLSMLFLVFSLSYTQIVDDFGDGDFYDNPEWKGDRYDFVVNKHYQLQLDAYDAGESYLYLEYPNEDNLELRYYFKMDFNPSISNKLNVFICLDTNDISSANGYCITIGENGSGDKIIFNKLKAGRLIKLGEGNTGNFADSPSFAKIKVTRNIEGIWNIYSDRGEGYYVEELEVFDDEFVFENNYFILNPKYSKTRIDKFFFDDFYLGAYIPDTIAPKINGAELISRTILVLEFDEPLSQENIKEVLNYRVLNSNISPKEVIFQDTVPNKLKLIFEEEFRSGIIYELEIKDIEDLNGNTLKNPITVTFYYVDRPKAGDIIINELLFNPFSRGSDFVELKNISGKIINLKGTMMLNSYNDENFYTIKDILVLKPGEYVCISKDTFNIINNYFVPDSSKLFLNKLPSLPNDVGNLTLYRLDTVEHTMIMIDSFDYSENMHSSFYDNYEGVSLERRNEHSLTNDKFNWSSASTIVGGATPGYRNSNSINYVSGEFEGINIIKKVFSPNLDGFDDELIISYNLNSETNLANMYIFDSEGRFIDKFINNETIGTKGIITWSGQVDNNTMPIGVYVVVSEILDERGNIYKSKETFVIANDLK